MAAPRRVGITRIHMEEDAGKSLHEGYPDSDTRTYLDFNRSGVPLIEIVSEPDLRSAADAAEFFSRLRAVLVAIGVNDGNMEEGSLRCDANVSVRPVGAEKLGVKVELKNLNSFRHVQRAIEYEVERQIGVLGSGGTVDHETRLVGRERRADDVDARQGGGARLPVFPGARSAAADPGAIVDRGDPRHAARAAGRAPAPVRRAVCAAAVRRVGADLVARARRLLRSHGRRLR